MHHSDTSIAPYQGDATRITLHPEPTATLARLTEAYGKAMTPEQIAKELEYTATYVAKKIGAAGYEHLPWVKAIAPHRRKRGLRWVYATEAVAKYLDTPQ